MNDRYSIAASLVNLEIPNYPDEISVDTGQREWRIQKHPNFEQAIKNLREHPTCCTETYSLHLEGKQSEVFANMNEISSEMTHICICLSYLSGQAITVSRSLPYSDMTFLRVGDGYPRERHRLEDNFIEQNTHEYVSKLNSMVKIFNTTTVNHNINIIILHLIDSMYFWSLEDLFLGLCTILEIIKQNEIRRLTKDMSFHQSLNSVSKNIGISKLTHNIIKMRNDLIHYGKLSAINFSNKTREDCAKNIEEVAVWIDSYIHALFSLPAPNIKRASFKHLEMQNSYTVW